MLAMVSAADPDIRTTPMALRPGGVDNATIVSSEETILWSPSRTLKPELAVRASIAALHHRHPPNIFV